MDVRSAFAAASAEVQACARNGVDPSTIRSGLVACDDVAIERAARMLCHEGMDFADGWVRGDTDRDYPRLIAEAVLRSAGEVS